MPRTLARRQALAWGRIKSSVGTGCDRYVSEYSPQEYIFFGCAILNGDFQNSEWGYDSLDELRDVNVRGLEIDRDLHRRQGRRRTLRGYQSRAG